MHNQTVFVEGYEIQKEGLNAYIAKVFGWTFLGILVTALTSIFFIAGAASNNPAFVNFILVSQPIALIAAILTIIFLFIVRNKISTMNPTVAKVVYMGYAMAIGVSFSMLPVFFELAMIGAAFLITSATFGIMAIYGLVTKKDLTSMGSILAAALIGLIIAMIVNMFIGNGMLDFVISVAGVFIFLGLTAWDAQNIKSNYARSTGPNGEATIASQNLAILSALGLYLNFINLFRFILAILYRRD
ncbi:MAG: Bax inhibitor-1/YccA family protein [Defluviitaleaceae bacterium]|nr:Bax inhibitor-1/YccA family protein [Defluviitaleaceae bacterium]